MERTGGRKRKTAWGLLAVGGAGLVCLVAAGLLAVGSLGEPGEKPQATANGPSCCAEPAVHDRKRPSDYGLPTYPGAFEFHSVTAGLEQGSTAFSVRRGTAREVAAYYRKKLPGLGWEFQAEQTATERPGNPGDPKARTARGLRQIWVRREPREQLQLLALDLPQKDSTAQVVLGWAALAEDSR